ncbi:MAG TPA: AAA family ATPase, partial [Sphaerochaeta sp.]|nr:AAA family ATPase [Sphaerochaeta sp.]
MKILELRFKNLNSLYGEWHIDFTNPEYAYNGIFALTGPTGAGKSTILDAICLALYGSTPRLGRITQSSNDIMSRQTGECYAEVVFASQAGTYRCHWAHHRSRKRSEGELQSPRHEISEANDEGKVIENKLTSVLSAVEEKTGMDFDRFTRSILLAQGGFDTFLKASVEQKSKILEQITGTKIYSDISIAVHERLRDERGTLANLEAETRGIPILTQEAVEAIEEELKLSQLQELTLGASVSDHTKAIAWLNGITELQLEIQALAEEEHLLAHDILDFAPDRKAFEQALQAATLEGSYATLSELREQQKIETSSLEKEVSELPELESAAIVGSEKLFQAEELTRQAKTMQKAAIPLIRNVRSLDQNLTQMQKSISESNASIDEDTATISQKKFERDSENEKVAAENTELLLVDTYLRGHDQDKALVSDLTGIIEQLQTLSSKQKTVTLKKSEKEKAAKACKAAEKVLTDCKTKSATLKEKLGKAQQALQGKKEELSRLLGKKLLREYRSEKDNILREREYLARIAALEEHRNHLIDGKACPLCGSLEHPFAIGNVPTSDETEKKIAVLTQIITDAESLEAKIQTLTTEEQQANTVLASQEKKEIELLHAKESVHFSLDTAESGLLDVQQEFFLMEAGLREKLKPYDIKEIPEEISTLIASLRLRKDAWQKKEADKKIIESTISSIKGEIQRLDGVIDTQESALKEKISNLQALVDTFNLAKLKRQSLYGDRDADTEEEKLSSAVLTAEKAEKQASKESADLLQKVSTSKTRIESLQASLAKRIPIVETKESLFLDELASFDFPDEQQFLCARLSLQDRNRLALQAKKLDDRNTELKTKLNDRKRRLGSELAKKMTDKPLVELQDMLENEETDLKKSRDTVAEHKAKLAGNADAKQRIESKQEAIESQRKECLKWERLHFLIGSADGKKFRNFAQGLTFELMVSHANRQLAKMSDRYLLIRSEEQPLELNVIDNYQAGEIRSTKNLSGGESFIVSLTLALGLSKMASKKVRVDSLFLDEGFGT